MTVDETCPEYMSCTCFDNDRLHVLEAVFRGHDTRDFDESRLQWEKEEFKRRFKRSIASMCPLYKTAMKTDVLDKEIDAPVNIMRFGSEFNFSEPRELLESREYSIVEDAHVVLAANMKPRVESEICEALNAASATRKKPLTRRGLKRIAREDVDGTLIMNYETCCTVASATMINQSSDGLASINDNSVVLAPGIEDDLMIQDSTHESLFVVNFDNFEMFLEPGKIVRIGFDFGVGVADPDHLNYHIIGGMNECE